MDVSYNNGAILELCGLGWLLWFSILTQLLAKMTCYSVSTRNKINLIYLCNLLQQCG